MLCGTRRYPQEMGKGIVSEIAGIIYIPVILSLHIIIEIFEPTVNNQIQIVCHSFNVHISYEFLQLNFS